MYGCTGRPARLVVIEGSKRKYRNIHTDTKDYNQTNYRILFVLRITHFRIKTYILRKYTRCASRPPKPYFVTGVKRVCKTCATDRSPSMVRVPAIKVPGCENRDPRYANKLFSLNPPPYPPKNLFYFFRTHRRWRPFGKWTDYK